MKNDSASIVLSLLRATHRVLQMLEETAKELDVSPVEMNVLASLGTAEDSTVSQLGRATGMRPSTTTGVLDRLEARGLLERRPNPADRRSANVALTKLGESVAQRVLAAMQTVDDRVRDCIGDGLLAGYHEVVGALGSLMSSAGPNGRADAH
jgi:DNA-binding MarR family transcriptional regulator